MSHKAFCPATRCVILSLGLAMVLDGVLAIPATMSVCAGSHTPSRHGRTPPVAAAGTRRTCRACEFPSSLLLPWSRHTRTSHPSTHLECDRGRRGGQAWGTLTLGSRNLPNFAPPSDLAPSHPQCLPMPLVPMFVPHTPQKCFSSPDPLELWRRGRVQPWDNLHGGF